MGQDFAKFRGMFQQFLNKQEAQQQPPPKDGTVSGTNHNGAPAPTREEKEEKMRDHLGRILSNDRAPNKEAVCFCFFFFIFLILFFIF